MKMAEGDFAVVFFDGEREIGMGNVRIRSSLNFKTFQLGISQRIGISPNQITVYLAGISPEHRRKIPITNKSDFSLLVRETGCYFLVVLKRTRRHRRPAPAADIRFAERMREVHARRENYLAEMGLRLLGGCFPTIRESLPAACRQCEAGTAEYHHCVRDAVVVGFRTSAGPIAPPSRQLID